MSEEQVLPVETKPEATPQETVPATVDQQPAETEPKAEEKTEQKADDEVEHKPSRLEKRFAKMTREKYELRGENEALKKMLGIIRPQQPVDLTPKREQFADDADYLAAMVQHEVKKAIPAQQPARPVVNVDEVKAVFDDYDEVMEDSDSVSVPQSAAEAIMASDKSEHLRYYFTKNPDKANALFQLPPIAQIREVGKIEAGIEREIETRKSLKTEPKKQSKAPAPINPVKPTGATIETDLDKLPMAEFMKRRNAEELKRRGMLVTR